jgi:hypothetical protein
MTSLNSLESITSDFGDSLLSSLQFEFSKFDITLPPENDDATITEKDLESSAAVSNADAIIEHLLVYQKRVYCLLRKCLNQLKLNIYLMEHLWRKSWMNLRKCYIVQKQNM